MSGSSNSAACGGRWAPGALEARALGASVALRGAPFRAGDWDLCVLAALMLWPFALAGAGLGALLWAEPGEAGI